MTWQASQLVLERSVYETMEDIDLRDTRGRLRRLALAASIAAVFTMFVMRGIVSVAPESQDPTAVPVLAIAMFVITTVAGVGIIGRFRRRNATGN